MKWTENTIRAGVTDAKKGVEEGLEGGVERSMKEGTEKTQIADGYRSFGQIRCQKTSVAEAIRRELLYRPFSCGLRTI